MRISIQTHLQYVMHGNGSLLLQIEAAQDDTQVIVQSNLHTKQPLAWNVIGGEDGVGQRRWAEVGGNFACSYHALVDIDRPSMQLPSLKTSPIAALSENVTPYIMPSRYCHPEAFFAFVPAQFGDASGGTLVQQMSDWIYDHFTYDNAASNGATTATDSFHAMAGVCRDYAHVLIAMARAVGIPARMASVYAPNVKPQDFHAVVEVYLEGAWHLVDPTGMADPDQMVRIGVGRDAADVSFMTSYGQMDLLAQTVDVQVIA
ncbi:transglutaminase superfamily protein [Yoonia maricola]|uniref:Transglutaminase superfamily protein n=1 Tax=Yoonia maricola TaxID=420999 RepID=A0A2M8W390_9RHOB|nr:transglutaminase family protein [Yoonia maricola]PJI85393.1 transglutaminase superfamily protein [Yoonia maricola]